MQQLVAGLSDTQRGQCLQMVLRLLYTSEFLLLAEFIEMVIPAIYCTPARMASNMIDHSSNLRVVARAGIYVAAIYYLFNRTYFDSAHDLNEAELRSNLANIAIYALLEGVSFILVSVLLR